MSENLLEPLFLGIVQESRDRMLMVVLMIPIAAIIGLSAWASVVGFARQRRLDRKHMEERTGALGRELDVEPQRLREHYRVASQRIEAVGLVYLIPETR